MPKKKKRNPFTGVDDIWQTKKYIGVRNVSTAYSHGSGKHYYYEDFKYYPKTKENLNKAKSIYGFLRYGK